MMQVHLNFPMVTHALGFSRTNLWKTSDLPDLIALGMPLEDHIRLTIKGEFFDPVFADYVLELYGYCPDLEPNERDERFGAPAHTVVHFPSKPSGYIFTEYYYFWLQRVRHRTGTVRDLVWHPDVRDYLSTKRNVWGEYSEPARALLNHVQQHERRGRRESTGYFKSNESFIKALGEVLKDRDTSLSVAQGLFHISRHRLWQGKALALKECQCRRKTLRNWLNRSGLNWDQAKQKYCKPRKKR